MTDPTIHITDPTLDPTGRFTMSSNTSTPGLNLLTEAVNSLTQRSESSQFKISLVTDDAATAQVIHQRIQQLIYNLGDCVQIDVDWTRQQREHLDNSVF